MTENAAKKDIQKLQRAIVDALEDVKAQEIQVFDTEHLSSLFERVIIASGTSNRQTKALSASVRDKVRNAGFAKPRIEGEDNGEWIIVDCGPAVVHIMQPTIRTYYNLEEIWGGTPVRLKFGAPKPAATAEVKGHIQNSVAKKATGKASAKSTAAKTPAAKKSAAKTPAKAKPALKAPTKTAKAPAKTATKTAAKTAPKASSPTSKPTVKTVGKPTAKPAAKSVAKPAAQSAAKKAPARKAVQATTRRKAD
ncbi:ribosome silencing factor [Limnohabitans sp. Hippo3]|uniref:ribosome silencing factor n=1 Tax=Limnohabitans sp. Hippo3 TaxID=1597956 RepID=UPI000D3A5402|nr:ribosome silencing factor [Limnohabitans sp. Hippo3]PUE43675.1 ribosome silencing factor [Limnohabitans sp. Hippo3]